MQIYIQNANGTRNKLPGFNIWKYSQNHKCSHTVFTKTSQGIILSSCQNNTIIKCKFSQPIFKPNIMTSFEVKECCHSIISYLFEFPLFFPTFVLFTKLHYTLYKWISCFSNAISSTTIWSSLNVLMCIWDTLYQNIWNSGTEYIFWLDHYWSKKYLL